MSIDGDRTIKPALNPVIEEDNFFSLLSLGFILPVQLLCGSNCLSEKKKGK